MKQRRPETIAGPFKAPSIALFGKVAVQLWVEDEDTRTQEGEEWTGTLMPNPDGHDDPDWAYVMPDEPRGDVGYGHASIYPRLLSLAPEKRQVGPGAYVVWRIVLQPLVEGPSLPPS